MTYDVQARLYANVEAWRTYDPSAIAALLTEYASYAYHPWEEGEDLVQGRDAIVANRMEDQDEPGAWEAHYRPLMFEGQRALASATISHPLRLWRVLLESGGPRLRRRESLRHVRGVVHDPVARAVILV